MSEEKGGREVEELTGRMRSLLSFAKVLSQQIRLYLSSPSRALHYHSQRFFLPLLAFSLVMKGEKEERHTVRMIL